MRQDQCARFNWENSICKSHHSSSTFYVQQDIPYDIWKVNIVKPKSRFQIESPKSKVQRKGTGTGADTIILQEEMSIFKIWSNVWTSQIQAQINSHWNPRLDPIDSKSSLMFTLTHSPDSQPLDPLVVAVSVLQDGLTPHPPQLPPQPGVNIQPIMWKSFDKN